MAVYVCREFSRRNGQLAAFALFPHVLYVLWTNLVDFPHVLHKVLWLHTTSCLNVRADDTDKVCT